MKKIDFVDFEELKKVNSKVNILENKVNEKEKGNLLGGGKIRFFEDLNFKHGFFSFVKGWRDANRKRRRKIFWKADFVDLLKSNNVWEKEK